MNSEVDIDGLSAEEIYILGKDCRGGTNGGEKDPPAAIRYFRAASEKGSIDSRFVLGVMYYNGEGVPKDLTEAFNWFNRAALDGHVSAQRAYARCLELGHGTAVDSSLSRYWYVEAALRGSTLAKDKLQNFDGSPPSGDKDPFIDTDTETLSPSGREYIRVRVIIDDGYKALNDNHSFVYGFLNKIKGDYPQKAAQLEYEILKQVPKDNTILQEMERLRLIMMSDRE